MKIYQARIEYDLIKEDLKPYTISESQEIYDYIKDKFPDPMKEAAIVILVNSKNKIIAHHVVSIGTVNSSLVNPSDVLRPAILASATGIFLTHNHPSGNPTPSHADIEITKRIKEASEIMNVRFLDHIICGDSIEDPCGLGYFSFLDSAML
jgi:DNA repair protein RadC